MKSKSVLLNPLAYSMPHFDHWLGVWAIEPSAIEGLISLVAGADWGSHMAAWDAAEVRAKEQAAAAGFKGYYRSDSDGVAVLSLNGTLQKQRASMSAATSTVLAKQDLRAAVNDDSVGAILLAIDSPGGTSAGTAELAEAIAVARTRKPVFTHFTDLGASAAYWVGSQASAGKVFANEAALVGSIGTYAVVSDYSALAAKEGVKVHVVRAGEYKGTGVPGTEVTAAQLAEMQSVVDSRNEMFLAGVASGRSMPMERVRSIADGRVYAAKDAVGLGLIDGVASFDSVFAEAATAAKRFLNGGSVAGKAKGSRMSDGAVSAGAIRAACPGASDSFVLNALESGHSIEQSMQGYMSSLVEANKQLNAGLVEAKASADKVNAELATVKSELETAKSAAKVSGVVKGKASQGVEALADEGKGGSTGASYMDVVAEQMKAGKSRSEAMKFVNRHYPELRAEFVGAANKR
jgi:signal peptide peptidase SppA